eukprot:123931-Hanusia_phi.AAC.3
MKADEMILSSSSGLNVEDLRREQEQAVENSFKSASPPSSSASPPLSSYQSLSPPPSSHSSPFPPASLFSDTSSSYDPGTWKFSRNPLDQASFNRDCQVLRCAEMRATGRSDADVQARVEDVASSRRLTSSPGSPIRADNLDANARARASLALQLQQKEEEDEIDEASLSATWSARNSSHEERLSQTLHSLSLRGERSSWGGQANSWGGQANSWG